MIKKNNIKVRKVGNTYTAIIDTGKKEREAGARGMMGKDKTLYMLSIHVEPELRRSGVGKKLISAIKKEAKPKQVKAVHIFPQGRSFWKKLGVGEGKGKFYKDKQLTDEEEKYAKKYILVPEKKRRKGKY